MNYSFQLTPEIVRYLQTIERVKETVRLTILPPVLAEKMRLQAQIRSTHYSTRIEGNRLTLKETEQVISQGIRFPGRERDVKEVEHYYQAIDQMEQWVANGIRISEERICKLHATLYYGQRAKSTAYRDGQNVIKDGVGGIVYLPPEARDVPDLMMELIQWIETSNQDLPVAVIAGITHYAFETIHPFYDGNGRTGRMLATWILYQGGYDLGKFYALEEFYAQDLDRYHDALMIHPNYYFGRDHADITSWLAYFLKGMANIFEQVAENIREEITKIASDNQSIELLRTLDYRARRVITLFSTQELIHSAEVASLLGVSIRQTRDILSKWVEQGWIVMVDSSKKGRNYRLAEKYLSLLQ
jgi:Fic family protein